MLSSEHLQKIVYFTSTVLKKRFEDEGIDQSLYKVDSVTMKILLRLQDEFWDGEKGVYTGAIFKKIENKIKAGKFKRLPEDYDERKLAAKEKVIIFERNDELDKSKVVRHTIKIPVALYKQSLINRARMAKAKRQEKDNTNTKRKREKDDTEICKAAKIRRKSFC